MGTSRLKKPEYRNSYVLSAQAHQLSNQKNESMLENQHTFGLL